MKKFGFKKGFSLAEAIIFVIITAILIAATTPIITRKIANIKDSGSTLGGGQHGRIELYTKEILTFGSDDYEKVVKDPTKGEILVIYERKDDEFYKKTEGKDPESDSEGRKSTIYEEITGATPIKAPDGSIIQAKKQVGGQTVTYTKSTKYIFEDLNITYKRGELKEVNGVTTFVPNASYIENNKRIIEGNLTDKLPQTNNGNTLWHLKVEGTNNAKGKVTPIPWQVTYGGTGTDSTVVSEGPIQDKDANGNPIASIDIPSSAANVTIHAVGGGGAGGAADKSSMNAYLDPKGKGAASQEIKELKKILAQRVREAAEKKGFTDFASKSDDDIVLVTDDRDFGIKNANFQGKTIAINTNNGTISGIFDTRTGFVFPDEILDYTEVLGSKSQDSVLYDMPQWFKWGTITQPQTGRLPFLATVYTCDSTAGGSAGDIIFHSNKDVQRCLQKKCTKNYTNSSTCNDDKTVKRYTCSIDDDGTGEPDSQTVCNTRKLSNAGYSCSKVGTSCTESTCSGGYCNKTFFDCSACKANNSAKTSVYQSNSNDLKDYKMNGSCSTSALGKDCLKVKENNCAKRTENLYTTIFAGGKGGAKGPCVYASVIVTGKVSASKTCDRQGGVSGDSTKYTITGNEFGTGKSGVVGNNGMDGVDCTVQISSEGGGSDSSTVYGGKGGMACQQPQEFIQTYTDQVVDLSQQTATNLVRLFGKVGITITESEAGQIISDAKANGLQLIASSISGFNFDKNDGEKTTTYRFAKVQTDDSGNYVWGTTGLTNMVGQVTAHVVQTEASAAADKLNNQYNTNTIQKTETIIGYNAMIDGTFEHWGMHADMATAGYEWNDQQLYGDSGTHGQQITSSYWPVTKTNSSQTGIFLLGGTSEDPYFCKAVANDSCTGTGTYACGANGKDGYSNDSLCSGGVPEGAKCSGTNIDIYNSIYTWTIPYATNYLGYGEGGGVGEYKTTKVSNVNGKLLVTLGKGGVWNTTTEWKNLSNTKGVDGTATIVEEDGMFKKKLIVAKGGKGGNGSLKTNRYDYCFARDTHSYPDTPKCFKDGNSSKQISCCLNGKSTKTVSDIIATHIKASEFENIKTLVGNSKIVGLGLGRGAQGAGTKANGFDQVSGTRTGANTSTYAGYDGNRKIYEETSKPKNAPATKNVPAIPSALNFKGGDGAVIITW